MPYRSPSYTAPLACALALAALCAVGGTPPARALDPKVPLAELSVQSWGAEHGLPSATVRAVARGRDGVIHLATDVGLVAFDGLTFERRTRATDPALPADVVEVLRMQGDILWIGGPRGLAALEDGVVRALGADVGLPPARVLALAVDTRGALWAATSEGVFVGRGGRFTPLERAPGEPFAEPCPNLAVAPDGTVALACSALYLWREGRLERSQLAPDSVNAVAFEGDGTLWLGFYDGRVGRVVPTRPERFELVHTRAGLVAMLAFDDVGALWIGGSGPGAQRRTPDGRIEALLMADGSEPAGVLSIVQGGDGDLLLATTAHGLVRAHAGRFRIVDRRVGAPRNVLSLHEDRGGTLWIAGNGTPNLHVRAPGAPPREITLAMPALVHHEAHDGTHWVGTAGGLFRVQDAALVPEPLPEEGAPIGAIAEGNDGTLYLGALQFGLFRKPPGGKVEAVPRRKEDVRPVLSLALAQDHRTLWVGDNEAVCRLDLAARADDPAAFACPQGLGAGGVVIALHVDAVGALWAALYEGGLVHIADGRAVAFGKEQGLPWDTTYAVLEDALGRLWIAGPTSIARVTRAAFDEVVAGRSVRLADDAVRVFDHTDGLPARELNGGAESASKTRDGRFWFATPEGAAMLDPRVADAVPAPLAAVITARERQGRPVARDAELAPHERDLLVRFTAPTFERPEAVRFRYRLDGVDDDWVDAGTRRIAMYTDLPPGPHTFRVAAVTAAGVGPEAAFAFTRAPAFVETWAFRGLVAAAAALVLFLAYRWRVARLVARQRELAALVAERTRDLAGAKIALEEANAGLAQKVDAAVSALRASERMAAYGHTVAGVAHEVRQPLFALGTAAFVLGDKLRDRPEVQPDLHLLERETRRMNRVMEDLLEFAKPRASLLLGDASPHDLVREAVDAFRAAHDPDGTLAIDVACAPDLPSVRVDATRVQQVLVNLVHNAHKHAAGMTRVRVTASAAGPDAVALEVADDGRGIRPADLPHIFEPFFTTGGTGLGLAITRRIVDEHGGTIEVRSSEAGTTFRIVLTRAGPPDAGDPTTAPPTGEGAAHAV